MASLTRPAGRKYVDYYTQYCVCCDQRYYTVYADWADPATWHTHGYCPPCRTAGCAEPGDPCQVPPGPLPAPDYGPLFAWRESAA
jgi:hypothetical protein